MTEMVRGERDRPWDQPALLGEFREGGVLAPSDVHLATTLARLAGETDPKVTLAVALAARAPRFGHVGVDLSTVEDQVAGELDDPMDDLSARLEWPEPGAWWDAVRASPLVSPTDGTVAPIVVNAGLVYLERYRTYELVVARHLLRRADPVSDDDPGERAGAHGPPGESVVDRLLVGPGSDRQRAAVRAALSNRLTVLVGGPGTGKTTTVAAMVAAVLEQTASTVLERSATTPLEGTEAGARGSAQPLRIALAAPTGKAAARLGEAFREAASRLSPELAAALSSTETSTIHRLLRPVPGSRTRFRHHAGDPLPHDVVIVDESSMISLPLMARLLDGVRPDARLVIVGDPGQLASVEAGSVLADLAGPVADPPHDPQNDLPDDRATDQPIDPTADRPGPGPLAGCVTALDHSRRFPPGSPVALLAAAIRSGDVDGAEAVLTDTGRDDAAAADGGAVEWLAVPADDPSAAARIRDAVVPALVEVARRAADGEERAALDALGAVRVLCAHRLGPFGVGRWNALLEGWLAAAGVDTDGWYPGRPVLVTANDHRNRLYNGDLGVVVRRDGRPMVAFERPGPDADHRLVGPSRLDAIETTHAMTIHKSQGSEFDHVIVVLPPAGSRLANRELLYTAITRARRVVTVVGDREALAAGITQRTVRASGLRADLWP